MSCCKTTNQLFITSFCLDGDIVIANTNQPITAFEYPTCFKVRIGSCTTPLSCSENNEVEMYVNGDLVTVLNRYGTPMKYGEFVLNLQGCLDRRYTYIMYVSLDSKDKEQILFNNAPRYIARG